MTQVPSWLLVVLASLALASVASSGYQHSQDTSNSEHNNNQQGNLVPLGSEGSMSSSMDSAALLAAASDDLIAAESSQSPDEHKAFTSGQALRPDPMQQMAASVAPASYQPQQQQGVAPQQQQAPFQGGPLYHHQPMQMRLAPHQAQQGAQLQHPGGAKPYNPYMAAALAGNFGHQQQQLAAAASFQHPVRAMHHPQQGPQPHLGGHLGHLHPQQPQQQQQQHQPQHHALPYQQRPEQLLQVQESSQRQNILPAPAHVQQQQQQPQVDSIAPVAAGPVEAQQQQAGEQQSASSVQHHVIASASSPAGSQVDSAVGTAVAQSASSAAASWPLQAPDIPKIVNLEVKCEKNLMKVSVEFDKVFNGVIFSKGHYSQGQCVHVAQNSGKQQAYFDISINSCGTQGNTQNGLYGMGGNTGSGTFFENTIVIQYDASVQEVYDHARKLRCTWHDQYEKAVTFRPFPVDMLDIVRADFAGDNVGCWMQIQVGKGPWASEVAGIVKIGQTMTMVLAIKDEENKFDMLVRNCFAHDGKRGPIELVDKSGCITRPKLMSRFTKIKNFGSSATVLSYAHFQAFKFPDSMEVHFQCTIQICRHQCPDQCASGANTIGSSGESYGESTISGTLSMGGGSADSGSSSSMQLRKFGSAATASGQQQHQRDRRDVSMQLSHFNGSQLATSAASQAMNVGLNRVIQVVSSGDLAFALTGGNASSAAQTINGDSTGSGSDLWSPVSRVDAANQICMSSYNFVLSLVVLLLLLLCSCLMAISLYWRQLNMAKRLQLPSFNTLKPAKSSSIASSCSPLSPSLSSSSSTSSSRQQQQHVPSYDIRHHHQEQPMDYHQYQN